MKPGLLMLPSAVSDSRVHNILPNRIETDFQFSRASAATRVNHQGLIENVGYFSDELVRNGDFSELGSELVTNGDFATDSDWNKGDGWSINNGKAVAENAGSPSSSFLSQNFAFVSGKTYKVVYTVSEYVKGSMRPQLASPSSQNLSNITGNGTYTEYIVANNNFSKFRFRAATTDGGFTGKIDNVSVKQVDPNDRWSLGTGWSYGDNKINFSNPTGTECFQSLSTDAGIYKISFDLDITSGTVQSSFSSPSTSTIESFNTSGTKTFNITTSASFNRFRFVGLANSVFSISNVSVVEVLGDKPRLDYDPTNPTCPHLLLEPQSTNLIKFSEDFTQSEWNKINGATVDANVIISPDGTLNASRLNFDTVIGSRMEDQIPGAASGDYSFAVYLKADEPKTVGIRTGFAGTLTVNVNVTTEWQRFSITQNNPTNPANGYAQIRSIDASGGSVYVWGAQIEQLSYSTSYIPTAGSTETRVGETCTNAGNADTFNSQEGVFYLEVAALANDLTARYIAVNDGSSVNRVRLGYNASVSNRFRALVVSGGSITVDMNDADTTLTDITQYNKIAFKYKANDFALYFNGTQVKTDTSGAVPTGMNQLDFHNGAGTNDFYGKVKSLATYNRALTDNELYTITSTQYSAYSGMVAALGNYTIPC